MTVLLDSNVLIALLVEEHVHHGSVESWLAGTPEDFATCPITEGSLVRLLLRQGQSGGSAGAVLAALGAHPRHEFWADTLSYRDVPLSGVIGHRQVTDAYLVHLARSHGSQLATLDKGLAALHRDAVLLVPGA